MAVTEFALTWSRSCRPSAGVLSQEPADLCISGGGFTPEQSLDTAIFMSLFLDARVDVGSTVEPASGATGFGAQNPRGWWGVDLLRAAGLLGPDEEYGSRLWQFRRAKLTEGTLEELQRACDEALAWLVSSEIASEVAVSVLVRAAGRADILILITRNNDVPVRFTFVWDALEGITRG